MNERALFRHEVNLVREYDPESPEITVDKHKVMQVLINLVRNAKYACDDSGSTENGSWCAWPTGGIGSKYPSWTMASAFRRRT